MQNDPVNFTDPSGLLAVPGFCGAGGSFEQCYGGCGFWGYLDPARRYRLLGHGVLDPEADGWVWWGGAYFWNSWGGLFGQDKPGLESALGNANRKPTDGGEPLSDCAKQKLAHFFDSKLLDSIRIHNNSLFVPPGFEGVAINNHIHFSGKNNQRAQGELAQLGHEIKHSQQYRENSFFLTRYMLQTAKAMSDPDVAAATLIGLVTGGRLAARELHPFEKEAEKTQADVTLNLALKHGKNDPCP